MAINLELEKLYYDDVKEREILDFNSKEEVGVIEQRTVDRIDRVNQLLTTQTIDLTEIWNLHYLAYLFQHSQRDSDYALAYEFAKKAVEKGSRVTRWLYAATLDRWLLSQGKSQHFGTQYKFDNQNWIPQPVDEHTTDQERKEYGVKSLSEYLSGKI